MEYFQQNLFHNCLFLKICQFTNNIIYLKLNIQQRGHSGLRAPWHVVEDNNQELKLVKKMKPENVKPKHVVSHFNLHFKQSIHNMDSIYEIYLLIWAMFPGR